MAIETSASIAGAVSYWSLSQETAVSALISGLGPLDLGDDIIPIPHSGSSALRLALNKVFNARGLMVRPRLDPDINGFEILKETRGQDKNKYEVIAEAQVDGFNTVTLSPNNIDLQDQIQQTYYYQRLVLDPNQVASMLTNIVEKLNGRTLRPRGGIYWIPESGLETWGKVIDVVENASLTASPNSIYLLRTLFDSSAVRAVKDAVVRDIQEKSAKLSEGAKEEKLGARALKSKARDATRLHDRISIYEGILGEALSELHTLADKTKRDVVETAVAAFPDLFFFG